MAQSLTDKEISHIANLAHIPVTPKEIQKYKKQLEETLVYIKNLSEIDTNDTTPTTHPNRQNNVTFEDGEPNTSQLTAEEALRNAKQKKNGYFIVPRIM